MRMAKTVVAVKVLDSDTSYTNLQLVIVHSFNSAAGLGLGQERSATAKITCSLALQNQGLLKVEIASSHFGYSLEKVVAKCNW